MAAGMACTKDAGFCMDNVEPQIEPWFRDGLRFKCTGCGGCCTGTPGYVFLSQEDLDKLAEHMGISSIEFAQKYTRFVDGCHALLDRPETYDCIFLDGK